MPDLKNYISYFSNELVDDVKEYLQVFDNSGAVKKTDESSLAQLTVTLETMLSDFDHLWLQGHFILGQVGAAL